MKKWTIGFFCGLFIPVNVMIWSQSDLPEIVSGLAMFAISILICFMGAIFQKRIRE